MYKVLFITLGTLSLGLGILGIFVPGLPTTPFLLLTAGLYARSSEKLYQWLLQNKYLGGYIRDFQEYKGMTKGTKIYSILLMWIMILLSVFVFIPALYLKLIILAVGLIGTMVMGFVIPTIRKDKHNI